MVRRKSEVSRPMVDHPLDGIHDATHCPDLSARVILHRWNRKEMPEQFVCTVDEINIHKKTTDPAHFGDGNSPPAFEERLQQQPALRFPDSGHDFHLMIEPWVCHDIVNGAGGA